MKHNYSREIAEEILTRMATGEPLAEICRDPKMPCRTLVYYWLLGKRNPPYEEFGADFRIAREVSAYALADDLIAVATVPEGSKFEVIAAAKLKADTYRWILSKLVPYLYGDRLEINKTETQTICVVQVPQLPKTVNEWSTQYDESSDGNPTQAPKKLS